MQFSGFPVMLKSSTDLCGFLLCIKSKIHQQRAYAEQQEFILTGEIISHSSKHMCTPTSVLFPSKKSGHEYPGWSEVSSLFPFAHT